MGQKAPGERAAARKCRGDRADQLGREARPEHTSGRGPGPVRARGRGAAQGHCTIGTPVKDPEDTLFRVEDGLITFKLHFDSERPTRRQLQIGDRRVRTTVGCAPDVFLYAPLLRPSVQMEEICPATGTLMRLMFTPSGVESADPAGVVVPIPPPQEFDRIGLERMTPEEADANCCAQCPFYSSAEAAQGWLAAHPGGRVFPVRQAWDLSFHGVWRDRMSALLNLGN